MVSIFDKLKKYYDEKALLEIHDKSMILIRIMDLKDDLKVDFLENLNEEEKGKILLSFSDKEKMFNYLYRIEDPKYIVEVASKIDDDSYKLKIYEKYLTKDEDRIEVINSTSNKDIKKAMIKLLKWNQSKIDVINNFTDKEEKNDYLKDDILNEEDKIGIINTFDEEEKKQWVNKLNNYENKIGIIVTLGDEEIKKELDKELPQRSEKNVILLINGLKKKEDKLNYIKNIKNNITRISLITQLDGFDFSILHVRDDIYSKSLIDGNIMFNIKLELCNSEYENILKSGNIFNNWSISKSNYIKNGLVISSPILKNTINDMKKLYFVFNLFKSNNSITTDECRSYLEFSMDYYANDDEKNTFIELHKCFYNVIKNIYYKKSFKPLTDIRLSNNAGVFRRGMITITSEVEYKSFLNILKSLSRDNDIDIKYNAKNNSIRYTFDSTIDYANLLNNIRLIGKLIEYARVLTYFNNKNDIIESINKKNDDEKLAELLNMLFVSDAVKKIYKDKYKMGD